MKAYSLIKREIIKNKKSVILYSGVFTVIFSCLLLLITYSTNVTKSIKKIIGTEIGDGEVWVKNMSVNDIKKVSDEIEVYTYIVDGAFWYRVEGNKRILADTIIVNYNGNVPSFVESYTGDKTWKNDKIINNEYPIKVEKNFAEEKGIEIGDSIVISCNQCYYSVVGRVNGIYELTTNEGPKALLPMSFMSILSISNSITSFIVESANDLFLIDDVVRGYDEYSGGFLFDSVHVALSVETILNYLMVIFTLVTVILLAFIINSFVLKRGEFITTLRALGYTEFRIFSFYYIIVMGIVLIASIFGTIIAFVSTRYINGYIIDVFGVKSINMMFAWYIPFIIVGCILILSLIATYILSIFSRHSSIIKRVKGVDD